MPAARKPGSVWRCRSIHAHQPQHRLSRMVRSRDPYGCEVWASRDAAAQSRTHGAAASRAALCWASTFSFWCALALFALVLPSVATARVHDAELVSPRRDQALAVATVVGAVAFGRAGFGVVSKRRRLDSDSPLSPSPPSSADEEHLSDGDCESGLIVASAAATSIRQSRRVATPAPRFTFGAGHNVRTRTDRRGPIQFRGEPTSGPALVSLAQPSLDPGGPGARSTPSKNVSQNMMERFFGATPRTRMPAAKTSGDPAAKTPGDPAKGLTARTSNYQVGGAEGFALAKSVSRHRAAGHHEEANAALKKGSSLKPAGAPPPPRALARAVVVV